MACIVAIHQPNYLGNLPFFHKIKKSDVFVFLDNVQYTKNGWTNRNKIKVPRGTQWLTVPILHKHNQLIKDVRIDNSTDWRKKHLKTFEMNYKKAPCYYPVMDLIDHIYYEREWKYLANLNIALINEITDCSEFPIVSSFYGCKGRATDLLINIVKDVGGDTYLSGHGAKNYLEEKKFEKAGIKLIYSDFEHPIYDQQWGLFVPNLSVIDALFNGVKL